MPRMKLIPAVMMILIPYGPALAECASGGLAVVVNKASSTDSLSPAQLRRILLGEIRNWPDHKPVVLVSRDTSSEVGKCVLSQVTRMSDAEYHRYLLSVEFRGGEAVNIKTSDSAQAAAKLVTGSPGAVAVVESSALPQISPLVKVVKIDGKLPGEPGYPY